MNLLTVANCITTDATTLTLTGSNFGPVSQSTQPSVAVWRVGSGGTGSGVVVTCQSVTVTVANNVITCLLPAGGVGQGLQVILTVGGQTSNAAALSFSGPKITNGLLSYDSGTFTPGQLVGTSETGGDVVRGEQSTRAGS